MVDATYRFCNVRLDARSAELLGSDDVAQVLSAKPYDVLHHLVVNAGRTISREELLQAVWTDTTVSDGSLSTAIRQVRRALQAAGCDEDVIRTVSRRGYRFVAHVQVVEQAGRAPLPVTSPAAGRQPVDDVPLFGRERFLGEVEGQLGRTLQGHAAVLYLQGATGIGKSATAGRVLSLASGMGFITTCVRCQAAAGAPPLWPVVQLLRRLVTELGEALPPASECSSPKHELSALLQRFGSEFAEDPDLDPASVRFLRVDAVARALSHAARVRPLCVLLDDLHAADASTRELIEQAAALLEGPLLLVATGLPGTAPPELPPTRLVHSLEPLSGDASRALLDVSDRQRELPAAERAALLAAAGGNPLLILELLRACRAGSELPRGAGAEEVIAATLERVMQRRIARLSAPCRALLTVAACHGYEFSLRRLGSLVELDRDGQRAAVAEACGAEVLCAVDGAVERYRFTQPLLRTVVYGQMSATERAAVHARIAEQLDSEALPDEDVTSALMHHHTAGGGGRTTISFVNRAVVQAGSMGAFATAHEHLAHAHDLRVADGEARAELLLQSAMSRAALGANAGELRGLYEQAFAAAKRSGAAELAARAALGYAGCRMLRGAPVNAAPPQRGELSRLREALDMQPTSSVTRVLLQARLGLALTATDALEEGLRLTEESVTAAEALRDPRTLCHALLQRARSMSAPGAAARRVALAEEARVLALSAGLHALERDAVHESAIARLRAGRISAAELEQLGALGQASDPTEQLRGAVCRLRFSTMRGDVRTASHILEETLPLAERTNPIVAETLANTYRWEIDRMRGQQSGLRSLRAVDVIQYQLAPWMGFVWLFALLDQGHRRTARLVYDTLLRGLDKVALNDFFLPAMGVAAWAAYLFEDARGGWEVHQRLLPFETEHVTSGGGLLYHAPVAHSLGVAALAAGEMERAEAHFGQAHAQTSELGAEFALLVVRKYQAFLDMRRGSTRRAQRALDVLRGEIVARGLLGLLNDLPSTHAPSGSAARELTKPEPLH